MGPPAALRSACTLRALRCARPVGFDSAGDQRRAMGADVGHGQPAVPLVSLLLRRPRGQPGAALR